MFWTIVQSFRRSPDLIRLHTLIFYSRSLHTLTTCQPSGQSAIDWLPHKICLAEDSEPGQSRRRSRFLSTSIARSGFLNLANE